MGNPKWGTKDWFDQQFDRRIHPDVDGWKIGWRASQTFRFELCDEIIKPILMRSTHLTLLEIGCALGDYTQRIFNMNPSNSLIGIDIAENAIFRVSKNFPEICFNVGSLPNLNFKDNSFNGIICLEVLYYLNEANQRISLAQIAQILKPDGFLLLSGGINQGSQYFNDKKIVSMISEYFLIEKIQYNYSKLYVIFERQLLLVFFYLDLIEKLLKLSKDEFMQNISCSRYQKTIKKGYDIMHILPFGVSICQGVVSVGKKMIRAMLSWTLPVRICYHMSHMIFGDKGKTQIIILARKKNGDT